MTIDIEVKKKCVEMYNSGIAPIEIYRTYFINECPDSTIKPANFRALINRWSKKTFPDDTTLACGTYEGFTAHAATVQVSSSGEIIQAWIKETKDDFISPEEFVELMSGKIEKATFVQKDTTYSNHNRMLEIPLFDMHWGIANKEHYDKLLGDILDIIYERPWGKIVIPFGQDFFHNDSICKGETTKGTKIDRVDMLAAVKDGRNFMCDIIDAAIAMSDEVVVFYSPGNHDRSISWMFMQVLLERYGSKVVIDTMEPRHVETWGNNAIMYTHGDSKQSSSPSNLAHIFPAMFPIEFANTKIHEVHCGHLHKEVETDVFGIMVRRLASGNVTDEWSNFQDYVGSNKRFMLFEYSKEKLSCIHYL